MYTEVWAHRGSSHTFMENSMAAFRQAITDGADGVELDVQQTKDGKLIVFHDEKLSRLTESNQCIWDTTWEELQKLTLKNSSEKIPSLEEVLKLFKPTKLTVNIELKNNRFLYQGMEKVIFDMVADFDMQDQVLYSSFNHESMVEMVDLAGGENCAILTSDIQFEPWHYVKEIGVGAYHPMINSLQDIQIIQKLQEQDINIHVWTADKEAYIYAGLLLGVDAIITNKPEKAVNLRKQFYTDNGKKALESIRSLGLNI